MNSEVSIHFRMLRYGLAGSGGMGSPGAVPEMKDLDEVGGFIDPVVDQDWSMHELADAVPAVHGAADVRKVP